jgi:hypothetical protein
MSVQNLSIGQIRPDQKDRDRVAQFDFYKSGMRNWFYGSGAPISSNAAKQAKLITCPVKLVKRAKATVARWGTRDYTGYKSGQPFPENVWTPFRQRLQELGFSPAQIREIADYRED